MSESMNDESNLFELLPGYALGALSDEERAQVESFLATSEAARAELRTYEAMLTGYAVLTPARKAPPHLNDNFRRRLAAEAGTERSRPIPIRQPAARTRLWIGLAALLILAVGVFTIYRYVTDPERPIREITDNPDSWAIKLSPQGGASGEVQVVVMPNSTKAVLIADHVPPLPAGKQYQLWMRKDQAIPPESVAVFSANEPVLRMVVTMSDVPAKYLALGITVEPRGGSPSPTTPGVYSWRRSQTP
jgi:anti-sigma-K factor RskA